MEEGERSRHGLVGRGLRIGEELEEEVWVGGVEDGGLGVGVCEGGVEVVVEGGLAGEVGVEEGGGGFEY